MATAEKQVESSYTEVHNIENARNKRWGKKLIQDETPLFASPSIAKTYGLVSAHLLDRMHYWLCGSTNEKDGHLWVYKSYQEWADEIPGVKVRTIRSEVEKLSNKQVIFTSHGPTSDRRKWYRINYNQLESDIGKKVDSEGLSHVTDLSNGPPESPNPEQPPHVTKTANDQSHLTDLSHASDKNGKCIYIGSYTSLQQEEKTEDPPESPPTRKKAKSEKSGKILIPDDDDKRAEILQTILDNKNWAPWFAKHEIPLSPLEVELEFTRYCNHKIGKYETPYRGFQNWLTMDFKLEAYAKKRATDTSQRKESPHARPLPPNTKRHFTGV